MNVSDLGERGVIELIWSIIRRDNPESVYESALPHPDDASALRLGDGRYLVLKTDMFVRRTDAPRGMRHRQMGFKAVVMNISDLAAKGARPSAFMFSLGMPRNYRQSQISELASGITSASAIYGAPVLGGDIGESRDLVVAGFAIGFTNYLVKRSGASPGDILAVTGTFGDTAAAFKILIERMDAPRSLMRDLCRSVYSPKAQLKLGLALAESGSITSGMDSSDGLAFTINELARSSKVGLKVDCVPASENALRFANINSLSPRDLALFGGEEYELVYTVKQGSWEAASKAAGAAGGKLIRIGEVIPERRVFLVDGSEEIKIPPKGWEHLR